MSLKTHINWGGRFEVLGIPDSCLLVTMVTPPDKWEFMKSIGWKNTNVLELEDEIYFDDPPRNV